MRDHDGGKGLNGYERWVAKLLRAEGFATAQHMRGGGRARVGVDDPICSGRIIKVHADFNTNGSVAISECADVPEHEFAL